MKATMILIVSCVLMIAAVVFAQQTQTQSGEGEEQQNQTSTTDQKSSSGTAQAPSGDAPKLTATKKGKQIASFKGSGPQTTKAFSLNAGEATFEIMLAWEKFDPNLSKDEGKFTVVLQDEKGSDVDLIIGTIDHFDGSRTVDIPKAGKYLLKITAPGKWSVDISQ